MNFKKYLWLGGLALMTAVPTSAQQLTQFDVQLQTIEAHAPRLQSIRARMEAQQAEARQSNTLEDPEVEFAYFWGNPGAVGNRWDLGVSQRFDFPTTYLHRRRAVRQACQNAEWQYRAERQDLLLQAQQLCIEMVYYNATLALAQRQHQLSKKLEAGSETRLQNGDITILDYNKIQTNHQMRHNELQQLEAERAAVLQELQALNGGEAIEVGDSTYEALAQLPPSDFEQWWQEVAAESPMMRYVEGEVERARQEVRVAKSGWWPKFSLGYASENADETYRGVSFGLSLPAWNNRQKVRQARAEQTATEMEAVDRKLAFVTRLRNLYDRTQVDQKAASDLAALLQKHDTEQLLTTAYNEGQITLHEYLTELLDHFDVCRQLLVNERDYQLSLAELWAVLTFSKLTYAPTTHS
jgi:outer membrane protein TolC